MENESIRDKNIRMMKEALSAKNYVRQASDKLLSRNSKDKNFKNKKVKVQQSLADDIRESDGMEDFQEKTGL